MNCPECSEWFEVWTNTGSPGLNFCPLCGYKFTEEDLRKMLEESPDADE
jgi:predicted amidophosphoribosyltransferase